MDTFLALPTSTTYTPLSPSAVIVEDIVTPIIPTRPMLNLYPYSRVVSNIGLTTVLPNTAFYYNSGIGDNPIAQHEINIDLRYKFLDKWLNEDYQDILRMLKVSGSNVKVLSSSGIEGNDISKDDEATIDAKSDFIGYKILTISKNKKILDSLVAKNNIMYYDLPHNEHFVKKEQAKYIRRKLKELQKSS